MGAAERRPNRCRRALAQGTAQRVDGGDLEPQLLRQVGKERGEGSSEHRLARPWRSRHQDVVPPGRGDLERPLGPSLAAHRGEVEA